MIIPTSTYRLQLRNGMTFEQARKLVPYWQALGISHLYLSPFFTAVSGSTHGYDVADANEIDAAIGGRGDFEMLVSALKAADIGVIIDIVPNHMAASLENRWWRDVLERGQASAHAGVFDIDWSERLTLPQLGAAFEEVLAAGDLRLAYDDVHGNLALGYFDSLFPLKPESRDSVLQRVEDLRPNTLAALSQNKDFLRELHDEQHWRLMDWRDGASKLSYRRFFEVTGLVGVRVEDPAVFQATHALILELVEKGFVDGLRVDHVDGLSDPRTYLQELRQAVGPDIYLVVEKILGPGEVLPEDWQVSGTTGYEFIAAMPHLFVDADGLGLLDQRYREIAGEHGEFGDVLQASKTLMVERNFEGEVARLVRLATVGAEGMGEVDFAPGIRKLLTAFDVYRTYATDGPLGAQDQDVLQVVLDKAGEAVDARVLDHLASLLRGDIAKDDAREFRLRFQQLSGPVMAKSMEDTAFYRYNRLIALNEVGGEPAKKPRGTAHFHALTADRLKQQPHGLTGTSTHDTKRGEDARARLYALSEGAGIWADGVERWRRMNSGNAAELPDGVAPEPNVEWMLYQSLAGVWPDADEVIETDDLAERLAAYVQKAVREAKGRTDWGAPVDPYEDAVIAYARQLVAADNADFIADFGRTLAPFRAAGNLNGLCQTVLKLSAPGIPDIYQGAEGLDHSLVDPDNRRVPDFADLERWLGEDTPFADKTVAARKQALIRSVLTLRREYPALFSEGQYLPLEVTGERREHVVAFARHHDGMFAIAVLPRLMFGKIDERSLTAPLDFWGETAVLLPETMRQQKTDVLTDQTVIAGEKVAIAALLRGQGVAFLIPATSSRL